MKSRPPTSISRKYQVIKDGYSSGNFTFVTGQVYNGQDKGAKFMDRPAITVDLMGKETIIPTDYVKQVADDTPITDTSALASYTNQREMIKSLAKLAGVGGGIYYSYKMGKGTWGYVGFGLLGLIVGGIVGRQVSNIILKKPISSSTSSNKK